MTPSCTAPLGALVLGSLVALGHAAPPDVPADHWALEAVEAVTGHGILRKADEPFEGETEVDRYAAAAAVAGVLDAGGAGGHGDDGDLGADVEALGSGLGETRRRLEGLDQERGELAGAVDSLKRGSFSVRRSQPFFSGLLSAGFVTTDDGGPAGATPFRTRFAGRGANNFFTLPRVAMMVGGPIRSNLRFHLHLDYLADTASRALLAAGRNVGVNEAYLDWTPRESPWTFRLGGFAPTFSSWEVDGRARTSTRTISPSAVSTFFESIRLEGLEARRQLGDRVQLRMAFTNGLDIGLTGTPPSLFGNLSDAPTIGALSRAISADDQFGGYLDLEVELCDDVVGRVGYLDLGGDTGARAPLAATSEIRGFHVGVRARRGDWELLTQAAFMDSDIGSVAGVDGSNDSWYASITRRFGDRDALTVRWDDWENEFSNSAAAGTRGSAVTVAWVRELSEGTRLQWEWIAPDEEFLRGAATDHEDDQFQARYTVSF